MFSRLGGLISRHWSLVIVAWLALAIALHLVAPRWSQVAHDGDLAYLPDTMPSVEGDLLLAKAFPDRKAKSQIAVFIERPDGKLVGPDYEWTDALAARFEKLAGELPIVDVWTRNSEVVGDKLRSRVGPHGQATVILLQLSNEFMATDNIRVLKRVEDVLDNARKDEAKPAGLQLGVTGSAAIGGDMLASAAESIRNTDFMTILLVVSILLIVYRAPVLVLIPLVTIGISLVVATDLIALLTQVHRLEGFEWWNFKVFTTTRIFIVVILFGSGTDFCLFMISRFKEELERGLDRAAALAEAVTQVSGALVGSALTTICGLGMMFFADFGKFRNSGPAIALALTVALCACLTLAPALLRACGAAVFWPFGRSAQPLHAGGATASTFWNRLSEQVVARPGIILIASVLLLCPLAYKGLSTDVTYDFLGELAPTRPSVLGTQMAKRHFAAGEMAPVTVLALKRTAGFDTPEGERNIALLTKLLHEIDGVDSVRSIAEPLGHTPGYFQPFRTGGLKKLAARKHHHTAATFLTQVPGLKGEVARFDLVLDFDPFSREAIRVLDRIDARLMALTEDPSSVWHQARFSFAGTTAGIRDLKYVTASDQVLIQQLVVLAVLAVLIVIVRRPLICVYLILSVLVSYYVTMGAAELYFSWLYGPTFDGLDWKVPIFLFVILIAVGEDYNIYLVTRVLEEQRRHPPLEGLRIAVARTGGIITSCGVIMAGTFISMMAGTLRGMLELGFALSLGILLDTCVVRPILVPAFLALTLRLQGYQSAEMHKDVRQPGTGRAPGAARLRESA